VISFNSPSHSIQNMQYYSSKQEQNYPKVAKNGSFYRKSLILE
jgi:hypothetical protein